MHDRAGSYDRTITDMNTGEYHATPADETSATDDNWEIRVSPSIVADNQTLEGDKRFGANADRATAMGYESAAQRNRRRLIEFNPNPKLQPSLPDAD